MVYVYMQYLYLLQVPLTMGAGGPLIPWHCIMLQTCNKRLDIVQPTVLATASRTCSFVQPTELTAEQT